MGKKNKQTVHHRTYFLKVTLLIAGKTKKNIDDDVPFKVRKFDPNLINFKSHNLENLIDKLY